MLNKSFVFSLLLLFSVPLVLAADDKPLEFKSINTPAEFNAARSKATILQSEIANLIERKQMLLQDRQQHYAELSNSAFEPCKKQENEVIQKLRAKGDKDFEEIKKLLQACVEAKKHEKETIKTFQDSQFKEEANLDKQIEAARDALEKLIKTMKQAESKVFPAPVVQQNNAPEQQPQQ